jgi:hypothetical protein
MVLECQQLHTHRLCDDAAVPRRLTTHFGIAECETTVDVVMVMQRATRMCLGQSNMGLDPTELECVHMEWIELARDLIQGWAFVVTVFDLHRVLLG